MNRLFQNGIRTARRLIVGVVGATILTIGVLLLVLPGPAFVVIPIGLGVLALEFEWARRGLKRIRESIGSNESGPRAQQEETKPPLSPRNPKVH